MGKISKILGFLAILTVTSGNVWAGDITTGYTFSSGEQNVTHTKLNNQVNNAVINPTFFTGKAAVTATASGDLILIYNAASGSLRKISALNLFQNNSAVITNQTEDLYPAPGDFILTFDISDGTLKKTTFTSAFLENTNLISARTNWNTPAPDVFYLAYNGDWSKTARSNLWYNLWAYKTSEYTNLTTLTTPTNSDALLVFDSDSGTHKQLPLVNLFSNATVSTSLSVTDVVTAVLGGNVRTINFGDLRSSLVTAQFLATNQTFTTNLSINGLAAGKNIDGPHGLGVTPKSVYGVLVCTAADLGYSIGDEIPMSQSTYHFDVFEIPMFNFGANSTNVFVLQQAASSAVRIQSKTTGATALTDQTKWSFKVYARP